MPVATPEKVFSASAEGTQPVARTSNPIGAESRNTVNNALKLMKSSANAVRHFPVPARRSRLCN
jgi:hypothetical protein